MSPDRLISSARSWIRTPYHHHARVKGAGVDCIQLLIAAHQEAGLVSEIDTGNYSTDWHLHRSEEIYLGGVQDHLRLMSEDDASAYTRNARQNDLVLPGSVLVFRVGRTFSHGGIITEWPFMVHACQPSRIVEEIDITVDGYLKDRPSRVFIHQELIP